MLAAFYESERVMGLFVAEFRDHFVTVVSDVENKIINHADSQNRSGRTALHYACIKGNVNIVTMLVDSMNVCKDICDKDGKPSDCAAVREHFAV